MVLPSACSVEAGAEGPSSKSNPYGMGRLATYIKNQTLLGLLLVFQGLGVCLPLQGTRVQSLVWEDPTGFRAIKPMHHSY